MISQIIGAEITRPLSSTHEIENTITDSVDALYDMYIQWISYHHIFIINATTHSQNNDIKIMPSGPSKMQQNFNFLGKLLAQCMLVLSHNYKE